MAGREAPAKAPAEAAPTRARFLRAPSIGRVLGALIGLVIVVAFLAITEPAFRSWGNIMNIFRAQSITFILAIGMTFVILTGGLDLSVASMTGFAGMVLGFCIKGGIPAVPAMLITIVAGALLGMVNGFFIGIARISFFVVTLATLSIYASVILVATRGSTISLFQYPSFNPIAHLANQDVGPVPIILLLILALYAIGWFVLHQTAFGRAVYATGSNAEAARLNGLNVPLTLLLVYALCGLMAGLGAIQQDGRLTAAVPTVDPNQMLAVIAAVLIGGMSLRGGEGGLLGTFLGCLFLGVIQNGLTLKQVSAFWQGTVTGIILLVAVGLAVMRETGAGAKIVQSLRRKAPAETATSAEP